MKPSQKLAISAVTIIAGVATLLGTRASDPAIPVGSLETYPLKVQAGTKPTLTWDITHPNEEVIVIVPPGEITPQEDLEMEVRILGASYQIGTRRGQPVWGYVQAQVKVGGASWNQFFYSTQDQINPSSVYQSQIVDEGVPIHFRARCNTGSYWKDYRSTQNTGTQNIIALTDGDSPPSFVPAFSQGNIESFLEPYLDSNGDISIGPMDVIYLVELGQTNTSYSGFDMQDLVLLVTFNRVES